MEQPAQVMPMTKDEFWKIYWFTPFQMVTVVNPKKYDYQFMFEGRTYVVKAGANDKIPGSMANLYLSQMTRIQAQDDNKMEFLSDFALMRQYYDKFIVDVESLVSEVDNTPSYLKNTPSHMKVEGASETPPWQEPVKSSIPETNSTMKNTVGEVTPTEKMFEFEGGKYKMVVDKNDKEMFFKDGKRIDPSAYAKAASML